MYIYIYTYMYIYIYVHIYIYVVSSILVDPLCIRFASIRPWPGTFMLEVRKSPVALFGKSGPGGVL